MATRKSRKSRFRGKTARSKRTARRRRSAVAGKIMPPLDVRSSKQLQEFKKRIEKGPVTFIMVWAPWCPHCHTMMPHFDAASKSPMRTAQSIKVEDKMLPAVNEMLTGQINRSAKPLNVEGFPSIIAVDKKGNVITDIEPIRNTNTMTKVMAEAGPIAEEAGLNKTEVNMIEANSAIQNGIKNVISSPNMAPNGPALGNLGLENKGLASTATKNIDIGEEGLKGSIASLNAPKAVGKLNAIPENKMTNAGINNVKGSKLNMAEATAPSALNSFPEKNVKSNGLPSSMKDVEKEAEMITSMAAPLLPPSNGADLETEPISNELTPEQKLSGGGKRANGGSLYSAMARTTFTLAPAAALLATAAMVMKKNSSKKRMTKKRHYRR
jgi:thiol-disulfide isomerase/thioredoxin